jgi:hemolysin III
VWLPAGRRSASPVIIALLQVERSMHSHACSPPDLPAWRRSSSDEFVNAATHALGFILAAAGAMTMASGLAAQPDSALALGCGLYLASLMAVFAMSTLSHCAPAPRWKPFFRRLDQGCIYLLIVATYTPFSLHYLRGGPWSVLLAVMWIVAIVGFVLKVFFAHRVETVSLVSYLLLGWIPVIALPEFLRAMPAAAIGSMFLGGVCYTAGTIFLTLDERVRHFHAVWHLFVIAGSACHFFGILVFVVGGAAAGVR